MILIAGLITVFMVAAMVLYSAFSWGYVSYVLYHWFILSALPTLPHFTVTQFVGIAIFLGAMMPHSTTHLKDEFVKKEERLVTFIIAPWVTLVMAWLIHALFF